MEGLGRPGVATMAPSSFALPLLLCATVASVNHFVQITHFHQNARPPPGLAGVYVIVIVTLSSRHVVVVGGDGGVVVIIIITVTIPITAMHINCHIITHYIIHIRYIRGIPCNPYSRMKKYMVHQFQDVLVDCGPQRKRGPPIWSNMCSQDPEMYSGLDDGVDPRQ